ncbi:MAG: hypothetical protein IJS60_10440 [Abditibacteriota bacterium]|nr:hypothetical protein [Abditibacteriota bacterium]
MSIPENEIVSISPVKVEEGNVVAEVLCSDDYKYFIDAYNYNIVDWDCPLGNNKDRNINVGKATVFERNKKEAEIKQIDNPKINYILFDTNNSKDVKYTDISKSFDIDKEDKGIARMEANDNKFIFRNGSYWYFINNKTFNMGGNCIIENGKLKLPEEFYKKVQDKDYKFF